MESFSLKNIENSINSESPSGFELPKNTMFRPKSKESNDSPGKEKDSTKTSENKDNSQAAVNKPGLNIISTRRILNSRAFVFPHQLQQNNTSEETSNSNSDKDSNKKGSPEKEMKSKTKIDSGKGNTFGQSSFSSRLTSHLHPKSSSINISRFRPGLFLHI